jgi:hypothetical protein
VGNETRAITIDPESELGKALADEADVVLERGGVRYRVSRVSRAEEPWADYDPEAIRAGLRAIAGTISLDQARWMKALVYRGREDGTRPPRRR